MSAKFPSKIKCQRKNKKCKETAPLQTRGLQKIRRKYVKLLWEKLQTSSLERCRSVCFCFSRARAWKEPQKRPRLLGGEVNCRKRVGRRKSCRFFKMLQITLWLQKSLLIYARTNLQKFMQPTSPRPVERNLDSCAVNRGCSQHAAKTESTNGQYQSYLTILKLTCCWSLIEYFIIRSSSPRLDERGYATSHVLGSERAR